MEYAVISAEKLDRLARKVNEEIAKGWEPLGGVCFDGGFGVWAQAMIKRREQKN